MPFNRVRVCTLALIIAGLTACGGTTTTDGDTTQIEFTGLVNDGPVTGASITVTDAQGNVLQTVTSDLTANYAVQLPAAVQYPLHFSAAGGTDSVTGNAPGLQLRAVALDATQSTVNLNVYTTFMIHVAENMPGGLTTANMGAANNMVLSLINFGLDANVISNPMHVQTDEFNIAHQVLANDALAETISRTQTHLSAAGVNLSLDDILAVLAGDISDGALDGAGPGSQPRVAVSALIASAQVMGEIINNELSINGQPASQLLDNAVRVAEPFSTSSTQTLPVLPEQVDLAVEGVKVAQAVEPSAALADLLSELDNLATGTRSSELQLDSNNLTALDTAFTALVSASDNQVAVVATAIQEGSLGSGGTGGTGSGDTLVADFTVYDGSTASVWSLQTGFSSGDTMYGDRDYTVTSVPAALENLAWIRTANDAKNFSGGDLASFHLNREADVYIIYRDDISTQPGWLSNYQDTGWDLSNSEPKNYSVYVQRFAAGSDVYLGPNGSSASGMYTVVIADVSSDSSGTGGGGNGDTGGDTGGGTSGSTATPLANNDSATTDENTAININVLANDNGLDDTPLTLEISAAPANGTVQLESDQTFTYTPDSGFYGNDSFSYQITDSDGDIAMATAGIEVMCNTCMSGVDLKVSWDPNNEFVEGYRIYGGTNVTSATQLLRNITIADLTDANQPTWTFDATVDLSLNWGDSYCFVIQAYNGAGTSNGSPAQCVNLPIN